MLPQASLMVGGRHRAATCSNQRNISVSTPRHYHIRLQLADGCSFQQQQRLSLRARAASKNTAPGATKDEPVAVPPPSNMQASVTLVPKRNASTALLKQVATPTDDPMGKFLLKCRLAWNLFFPPQSEGAAAAAPTPNLSPKELGKQRLQMILVADRCGLSPSSLVEMKRNTLAALSECMELEDLQDAHLRFTMTREGGTTYSMAVPILRSGPYADDGSVVGQQAAHQAANAAKAAAATSAGFPFDEDAYDQEQGELMYNSEYITDTEYHDVSGSAAEEQDTVDGQQPQPLRSQQPPQVQGDSGNAVTAPAAVVECGSNSSQDDVGMFKEQLKELLVEELVHDVEDLALQGDGVSGGGAVLHTESTDGEAKVIVALPPGVVVDGKGGVMSEQELREKAEQEVTRLLVKDSATGQEQAGATGEQLGV